MRTVKSTPINGEVLGFWSIRLVCRVGMDAIGIVSDQQVIRGADTLIADERYQCPSLAKGSDDTVIANGGNGRIADSPFPLIVFGITLFLMVVTGATVLPSWACIFNILLIASVLFPLRIGGAGNWAGAAMFLGLLFLV